MTDTLEKRLYDEIQSKADLKTIEQLIHQDVDCNLYHFDPHTKKFFSPIHLAKETKQEAILNLLYEHRNSPTKAQLEKHLQFYINHYDPSKQEENKILFDYIVSRFLYIHITSQYKPIVFDTLIAALHDYDGVRRGNQDLCAGSNHEIFLQLRIYTLFQMIIDIRARTQVFVLVLFVLFRVKSKSTSIHRCSWYLYLYFKKNTWYLYLYFKTNTYVLVLALQCRYFFTYT